MNSSVSFTNVVNIESPAQQSFHVNEHSFNYFN
jgi:hypothetical protein